MVRNDHAQFVRYGILHGQQNVACMTSALPLARDMVATHPSVGIVIYHEDLDSLLIVRQFRPAVISDMSCMLSD